MLEFTARKHCPTWDLQITALEPTIPECASQNPSHGWNTVKLDWWVKAVLDAPDGTELLLIDADTVILQPLDELWTMPFELMYTVRDLGLPFNGGVVGIRVSPAVRAFMLAWQAENARMVTDRVHHEYWRRLYGGINQASFGRLLARYDPCPCEVCAARGDGLPELPNVGMLALPCNEWNLVRWDAFRSLHVRILHIKSRLRRAVFAPEGPPPSMAHLSAVWHTIEQEMLQS